MYSMIEWFDFCDDILVGMFDACYLADLMLLHVLNFNNLIVSSDITVIHMLDYFFDK